MIRLLNAEPRNYPDQARAILRALGQLDERSLTRAELLGCIGAYDVLIVRFSWRIDQELLDAATRLRVIVTAATGLEHVDLAYAQRRGVTVLSLQGEAEFLQRIPATAEHTWALLLALVRRIPWAYEAVLHGRWDRDGFRGRELSGRRLGLVGLGRVGRQVARFGKGFDMVVAAYDPHAEAWVDGVERFQQLPELLRQSDVVSLHVSSNEQTRGLIGAQELAQLPPGALLINTSRGSLIDEGALVTALAQGRLAGAAVDVIASEYDEAARQGHPLLRYARDHQNLLITPHVGGATLESMERTEVFMAQKLRRWLDQQTLSATVGTAGVEEAP